MLTGEDFDFHSNLVRAVLPYGLTEFDVHDVLNAFQCTGLNDADQHFMKDCPARPGDHFEFFAEADLLRSLSTCPGGDLSVPLWGPDARDPLDVCRPPSASRSVQASQYWPQNRSSCSGGRPPRWRRPW